MSPRTARLAWILAALAACAPPERSGARGTAVEASAARADDARAAAEERTVELVESAPVETSLDRRDLRNADVVWREMIDGAEHSLDFAEFYASDRPGSRLERVVAAIEAAAARGVRVRFLAEKKFAKTYPETLDRLDARDGIEVRRYDAAAGMGGVLHAKYFLVDGREAFVGSQNFDWRSLEHIQELGARVRAAEVALALGDVFETDWALAGGAPRETRLRRATDAAFPLEVRCLAPDGSGGAARVTPVASPTGWLPDEEHWDLPRIVELIDAAKKSVRVQLLTYRAGRGERAFDDLESALKRAAARGAAVELLLADWCKRKGTVEGVQALARVPGVRARFVTIPQWSGGFIPHARVAHAKYLVVDGERAWLGTSNWERDYFHRSRNVGLLLEGAPIAGRLDRYFRDGWESPYAADVDPDARYEAPRIGE